MPVIAQIIQVSTRTTELYQWLNVWNSFVVRHLDLEIVDIVFSGRHSFSLGFISGFVVGISDMTELKLNVSWREVQYRVVA